MRINIDEKWKTDPRRKHLSKRLGSERLADGMLIEITWILFSHKGAGIPFDEFKFIENHEDWIASGLGHIEDDWVCIAGSDRYQEFFEKQSQNGSKGGRPSNNPEKPKLTQNNPAEPKHNPEKPSSSSSSSSSGSKKAVVVLNIAREETPPAVSYKKFTGPVHPGLARNSKREQALSTVPLEDQQELVDTYDLPWLKQKILKAISHYAKSKPVETIDDWPGKLAHWFAIEKDPKFKASPDPKRAEVVHMKFNHLAQKAWYCMRGEDVADDELSELIDQIGIETLSQYHRDDFRRGGKVALLLKETSRTEAS